MPNPQRIIANGRPVFVTLIIQFLDDVSANVSKLWNKHFVCYISITNLPQEYLDQEFNVRFVATSPLVNPMELMQGIWESFEDASKCGILAYDCVLHTECLLQPFPFLWAADNPMQSEECSHSGLLSNKYCHTSPQTSLEKMVQDVGVKDTIAQPIIECLKQLGKELWSHQSRTKKIDLFEAHLASLLSDSLNIPCIMASYMCQYHGSLIGKHFKSIVQIITSAVYDLMPQALLDTWILMGQLTILCWHTEIKDLKPYLMELQDVIDQFLTKTAICAPSIILTKPKFHYLLHHPLYIK
ncbi:hypothetical protein K439DRAFT_1647867 [Ramaria rubella]|nr:hypothetical protein K439DRAFT_1647867 [Ramaria rubella]